MLGCSLQSDAPTMRVDITELAIFLHHLKPAPLVLARNSEDRSSERCWIVNNARHGAAQSRISESSRIFRTPAMKPHPTSQTCNYATMIIIV